MPGSPPIRMAEPGTSPPPTTRSNSAMPVARRASSAGLPLRAGSSMQRPLPPLSPLGGASVAASSTIAFQAPQASQRPDHFGAAAPHSWQTYRAAARAIRRSCAAYRHLDRTFGATIDELVDVRVAGAVNVRGGSSPD